MYTKFQVYLQCLFEMRFDPTSIQRVMLESRNQTLRYHVKRTLFLSDISQFWDSLAK